MEVKYDKNKSIRKKGRSKSKENIKAGNKTAKTQKKKAQNEFQIVR